MRIFVLTVLSVAALYVWQRQSQTPAPMTADDRPPSSNASQSPASSPNAFQAPIARTREVTDSMRRPRRAAKRYRR